MSDERNLKPGRAARTAVRPDGKTVDLSGNATTMWEYDKCPKCGHTRMGSTARLFCHHCGVWWWWSSIREDDSHA